MSTPPAAAIYAEAMLDLGAGRWDDALEKLLRVAGIRPGFSSLLLALMTSPDRIEAAARAGDAESARAALAFFATWADQSRAPWAAPLVAACRAVVETGDAATELYGEAVALEAAARPFDRARIRLLYGEHLRRERRRVDARVQLRAAIDELDRLGAVPFAERARAELRASGETARKRDPSTLGQLTPQELQVAQLVARGLSNKEVAAQLFLSPRTVDAHLRGVFSKLDITSRTQLALIPGLAGEAAAEAAPA
jgi:DNA-binding CsgD family transcriptional regulator